MVEIKDNKIYVEGKETRDPMLIGLGMLDMLENKNITILNMTCNG